MGYCSAIVPLELFSKLKKKKFQSWHTLGRGVVFHLDTKTFSFLEDADGLLGGGGGG